MPEAIPGKPTAAASESTTSDVVEPLWKKVLNDRFTLLEPVGIGGMGKVYKAIQAPLDRVVAVKILTPNGGADPGFRQRFFLEASLTSKLRHPNTVTVIDYGETPDGIFFWAMEYLDGQPLSQVLKSGPLHWTRCIRIGQQICRSLREAHKLGIVHRDLKPGNVMLLTEDRDQDLVKVLDFGLVKSFIRENTSDQSEITNPGMLLGSPRYMAPEQLRNQADPRSDIYSLGAVLYEMLVGHPPFSAKDAIDVMFMHMNEPPKPLRVARPNIEVPKELEAVVMKCLEKQPAWRFQSMDDVLEGMRKAAHAAGASGIAGEIPAALDPTPPPRSSREILNLTEQVPEGTLAIDIDVVSPRERAVALLQPYLAKLKSHKVWTIAAAALLIVLVAYLGQRRHASAARSTASEEATAEAAKAPPVPLEAAVQKAPPATPAGIKTVMFKIASVPSGARVLVNGRAAGHTPLSVEVPTGADGKAYAELAFSLRGYQPLTVSTGGFGPEMALSQTLQPLAASPPPPRSIPEPRRREVLVRETREARRVKEVAEAAPERTAEGDAPSLKGQPEEAAPQMLAMAEISKPKPATEAFPPPPPPPPAAKAVLTFRDGMTPPEQLEGNPIVYSQAAIEAGVQGTIEAKCIITVRGTLENCRIVKSLPYMDKPVLQALSTRKYTPVLLEGKPVAVEYVFAIKLVLKEKERKCVGSRCDE